MPAIDYLSAIANELNRNRLNRQGSDDALRQALMKAKIEQSTKQIDPSNILSQLELMNVIRQMKAGGQFPQGQGGQLPSQVQPPPPISQPPQLGQAPQIQAPQTPPIQRSQPNIPQLGQTQSSLGQPQGQPPLQIQQQGQPQVSPFTTISDTSAGKYGQPVETRKTVTNPAYIPPTELAKMRNEKVKFEQKQKETKKIQEQKKQNLFQSVDDTLKTIGEIEKGIKYFGAAGNVPALPFEYGKKNWEVNLNKLMAKQVLKVMSDLKAASRTGSTGFGQLSEKELALLQNAATVLRKGLSEEDAQRYLNQIKNITNKVFIGSNRPAHKKTKPQQTKFNYLWEQ